MAQKAKRLSRAQETQVLSLGRKDLLEKEMATQSGTLAWKIPWTEEPGRIQSMGLRRVGRDLATSLHFPYHTIYPFKMYSSALSIFMRCRRHHCTLSSPQREALYP